MRSEDNKRRVSLWTRHRAAKNSETEAARQAVAHLNAAVVITGGSRGIGLALAERFMKAGRAVAIIARNALSLDEAVARLKALTGEKATAIICDVTEPNAPDVIVTKLAEAGLYLDVLVNNAGVGLAGPFVTHAAADLERLIALNVEATTRLTRAALPDMLARRQGGILNIASLGAYVPGPNQAAHYASKAYIVSLTEAIASEVSGGGVRVCVVVPGPVKTGFHRDMGAENSLYRLILPALSPERVARSAYFGFTLRARTVVPGMINKLMFLIVRSLPHPLTVPFVYWLLKRPDATEP